MIKGCTPPEQTPEGGASVGTSSPETASRVEPTSTDQPALPEEEAGGQTAEPPDYGTVSPDYPGIIARLIEFPGEGALITAYLARPAGDGSFPVVLVCHENRGLTEHIQDVARRLGKAGYVALAIDLLSRQGGTQEVGSANVPGELGGADPEQFVQDFVSGWQYLQDQPFAQADRVGMVGFCFGGGVTWLVATRMPELKAAVPFYGPHPPVQDVPAINAPVLAIYAERDQRINQGIPAIEEAMAENNKVYEKVVYLEVDHAFHNDTGSRYAPEAARDAWHRTLDWFATNL